MTKAAGALDEAATPSDREASAAAGEDDNPHQAVGDYNFVVVASRLPVDRVEGPGGESEWRPSPGGLVTALEPGMRDVGGAWVGWARAAGGGARAFCTGGV